MLYREELQLATVAAREAGRLLWRKFREAPEILDDSGRDVKAQADRDAEALILEKLAKIPHPVLAEESGAHGEIATGPVWVVDPLDGTQNFCRGIPLSCVSIALVHDLRPVLGVVFDFHRDELFCGIVGVGAWLHAGLNDTPIHVSEVRAPARASLATGYPAYRALDDPGVQEFVDALRRFKKVRLLGTAALELAWVAAGRIDAYAEDEIRLWDVAAGLALVEAAGGFYACTPGTTHLWGRRVRCAAHADLWTPAPSGGQLNTACEAAQHDR